MVIDGLRRVRKPGQLIEALQRDGIRLLRRDDQSVDTLNWPEVPVTRVMAAHQLGHLKKLYNWRRPLRPDEIVFANLNFRVYRGSQYAGGHRRFRRMASGRPPSGYRSVYIRWGKRLHRQPWRLRVERIRVLRAQNNLDGLPNFEPIDRGQVIKLIGDSCGQDVGKIRVAMVTLKQMGYALDGRIVSDAVRKRSQEGVAAIVRWSRGQTDEIE